MPDLAEQIAAIIDPPAWSDRAQLREAGRNVLRESERTQKIDARRRRASFRKAEAIIQILPAAMEQRALRAEDLLSSMMRGGEMISTALGEACETFGYLHACMFGAEQHLREHGWIKPDAAPAEEAAF